MEPPQDFGGTDEHDNGSESGWTMYIGLTTQNENVNSEKGIHADDGDESEDSMASDASSGPSHHELTCGEGEGSPCIRHTRYAKDIIANSKISSAKKPCKQFKTKDERRIEEQSEHPVYKAESAASQVSTHAKVRKTKMMAREE